MIDVTATTATTLCLIFADVLGVDRVRPQDGFFEVGGDSILAVQLVARAREAGLALVVRDLFDHQSPLELAAVTTALPASVGEQNEPPGLAAEPSAGSLLSDEFDDDLDFENTALSGQAEDTNGGWETLT